MPAPNRIALYLTAAAGLLGAVAPIVADLDIASVAGIAAGLAAIAAVVYKWMDGWSKWERGEGVVFMPGDLDEGLLADAQQLADDEKIAANPKPSD